MNFGTPNKKKKTVQECLENGIDDCRSTYPLHSMRVLHNLVSPSRISCECNDVIIAFNICLDRREVYSFFIKYSKC